VRQVAEWIPQGKSRRGRPANTWKDEIRESKQSRNLKDEKCLDRQLWRGKRYVLGLRKTVDSQKNIFNNNKNYARYMHNKQVLCRV
jgi:hypothetical protein